MNGKTILGAVALMALAAGIAPAEAVKVDPAKLVEEERTKLGLK